MYPTNFVEPEETEINKDINQAYAMNHEEEEDVNQETIESLASWGDSDALAVQAFEKDLEDLPQEVPDLHTGLVSFHEARARISERKKNRGFWPSGQKSSGKGCKSSFAGGGAKGY